VQTFYATLNDITGGHLYRPTRTLPSASGRSSVRPMARAAATSRSTLRRLRGSGIGCAAIKARKSCSSATTACCAAPPGPPSANPTTNGGRRQPHSRCRPTKMTRSGPAESDPTGPAASLRKGGRPALPCALPRRSERPEHGARVSAGAGRNGYRIHAERFCERRATARHPVVAQRPSIAHGGRRFRAVVNTTTRASSS